jgi:hypothetical protein
MSEQDPQMFLLNIAKRIDTEVESTEARTRFQTIIQMCRRHRGVTPSDRFGYWNGAVWAESPKFSQLHGTNIFQSLIRGAEANYYDAQIKLDISAKAGSFENRAAERLARGIYQILNVTQWQQTNAEQEMFYNTILKNNAYIISRFNKAKNSISLKKPEFAQMGYEQSGTAICPQCYSSVPYSSGTDVCPNCGAQGLSVMDDPTAVQDYGVSGFSEIPAGETEMVIASGLDVSVDDRDGRPADIKSAGWVEWRYFAQKNELQRIYGLKLKDKPKWSYPTRLKVALQRYQSGELGPTTDFDKQTYEVRQIWLDLAEYEDYVAPKAWTCGKTTIQVGERFADHYPNGMVFGYTGSEVMFCDGEDKNFRVKSAIWLADAASHYGLGAQAGLALQKKINILDNMAMEGEARSMKGSIAYVPEAVDGAHLEGQNTNIPLRPDFSTNGEPIKNFIMPVEVSGLSQSSLVYLNSQVSTMQRVMGVPDVTLGEGDPAARTASGMARIDQNATGLLIPAKRSEGAARAGWLMDQLMLIQEFYPAEAVQQFGERYGEEWLEDEIAAFLQADLNKAILISVVPGSEIPESRFDRQEKLRMDIMNQFVPLTPELQAQLARESGYEGMDVGFYESNTKLANKRYTWLKDTIVKQVEQLEMAYQIFEGQMTDPQTGQRAKDPMGNVVMNPVIQQLITAPQLQLNAQAENHEMQYMFWSAKVRELMASATDQPQVLIAACDAMMTSHTLANFEIETKKAALTGLSAQPAMAQDQLMQQSLTPPEPPAEKEKPAKPAGKAKPKAAAAKK